MSTNWKLSASDREVLECVLGMIFDHGADAFLDFIDGDDEERAWLDDFRETWLQMRRQCEGLCEALPHNAEKYQWQLGEFIRDAEMNLWRKMKRHPWRLLKRDAEELLMRDCEIEEVACK